MKIMKNKISNLNVEIGEYLFEAGLICNGCCLHPNNCEGSNCGIQMNAFYEDCSKSQLSKFIFKAIGDKYYNQSLRVKNEIRR